MLRKWCEFDGLSDFDKPQIRCMINIDSKSFPGFILRLQSNHTFLSRMFSAQRALDCAVSSHHKRGITQPPQGVNLLSRVDMYSHRVQP